MAFTAADVKTLREMTGVGMMDCKKALTASAGLTMEEISVRMDASVADLEKLLERS